MLCARIPVFCQELTSSQEYIAWDSWFNVSPNGNTPQALGSVMSHLPDFAGVFDHPSDMQVFHRYRCRLVFARELMADFVQKDWQALNQLMKGVGLSRYEKSLTEETS